MSHPSTRASADTVPHIGKMEAMRREVIALAALYGDARFGTPRDFVPGRDYIPASGKVFGGTEICAAVAAVLDGHWTAGNVCAAFERALADLLGVRSVLLTNSGSSANLLALAALMETDGLSAAKRLRPGDAVLTLACGFPTTVAPIIQLGLKPIFIDIVPLALAPDPNAIEDLCRKRRTPIRAVMMAHTLGYPLPVQAILRSDLPFVEDACDALGGRLGTRPLGSYGTAATFSFYPAHHITAGEGGAVAVDSPRLTRAVASLRDWGRDCWCKTGVDNTCGRRFSFDLHGLGCGYDHKYIYRRLGFSLRSTDLHAAIGLAQMTRLSEFTEARRRNWKRLTALSLEAGLQEHFIIPEIPHGASPFGWPLIVRPGSRLNRTRLAQRLEEAHRVGSRPVFGGNLLRQEALRARGFRMPRGGLPGTDLVAKGGLWLGVWPGLTDTMLVHMVAALRESVDYLLARPKRGD